LIDQSKMKGKYSQLPYQECFASPPHSASRTTRHRHNIDVLQSVLSCGRTGLSIKHTHTGHLDFKRSIFISLFDTDASSKF